MGALVAGKLLPRGVGIISKPGKLISRKYEFAFVDDVVSIWHLMEFGTRSRGNDKILSRRWENAKLRKQQKIHQTVRSVAFPM